MWLHLRVNVVLPLVHRFKGGGSGDVEDNEGTNSLLVVDSGHVAETFLPSNVPQLKPHHRVRVQVDHWWAETRV